MDRDAIIAELISSIEGFLKENNFEFVELIHRYEGKDLILRVIADRPEGGITMDECALLNRRVGELLDQKDIIQSHYILEVSSPGLDRPLKSRSDFSRSLNRDVKFFLNEFINGKLEWDGKVIRVDDNSVYVEIKGNIVEIPLAKITKAKQII